MVTGIRARTARPVPRPARSVATAYFEPAADFVDRIPKGAAPGDLPVEQPSRFHLAINLARADELDLTVPPSVIAQADEVFV